MTHFTQPLLPGDRALVTIKDTEPAPTEPTPDRTVTGDQPSGFTVPAGEIWEILELVTTPKNVVVYGNLRMRAGATLRFRDVDEAAFSGDDGIPVSDIGLWVEGDGLLDFRGTPKLVWARATNSIAAGQTTITLDQDPIGWKVGDEVAITPTEHPSVEGFFIHYDERTIAAISGRNITINAGCTYPHPAVVIPASTRTGFLGRTYTAEVLNLTRDVNIEGTPGGRSHAMIRSSQPHFISHAGMRHMGPQKNNATIRGRWAWHFHHMNEASRGSVLEGCVVRNAGSHAFVAHVSHGMTFRDCIAHDVQPAPFWWDQNFQHENDRTNFTTHDTLYENCVASLVTGISGGSGSEAGFRMGGFTIQMGIGNAVRRCVSVGIAGSKTNLDPLTDAEDGGQPNGYSWPASDPAHWEFEDNLSHNIRGAGLLSWINSTEAPIPARRFTAYHCPTGIFWGAYFNRMNFEDVVLYECSVVGVTNAALPGQAEDPDVAGVKNTPISYKRMFIDGCNYAILLPSARTPLDFPVQFEDCEFRNYRLIGVFIKNPDRTIWADFTRCEWRGKTLQEFRLFDSTNANDLFKVRDAAGSITGNFDLKRSSQPGGTLNTAWNAKVTPAEGL